MKNSKKLSGEEREARLWEFAKKSQVDVEISDDLLRDLGLIGWMEEDNSIARMRLILFSCTAIACTIWVVSGLFAYFIAVIQACLSLRLYLPIQLTRQLRTLLEEASRLGVSPCSARTTCRRRDRR